MINPTLSQAAGFATLLVMMLSYLFKSKTKYLLFQTLGLICMFFSYLFGGEYFAMITLTVSLTRTLTFFAYEKKDKEAHIAYSYLFGFLTVCAYLTVNLIILKTAKPLDLLYLVSQVMYAFVFRIRNINTVRYTIIIPHVLAIVYLLLLENMLFVAMSYTFELLADLYAIVKYKDRTTD